VGGEEHGSYVQAADTAAVTVTAGDRVQEWCGTFGTNGSVAVDAAITAIRIVSSHCMAPARTRPAAKGHLLQAGPAWASISLEHSLSGCDSSH